MTGRGPYHPRPGHGGANPGNRGPNNPPAGGGGAGGGAEAEIAPLLKPPAEKMQYFEKLGPPPVIRAALLDEEARTQAERFKDLPNTQLRRFYDPVVALRLRAQAGQIDPAQIKAELALMKARAAYAYKRPGMKVPADLVKFFTLHAHSVGSRDELLAFARHFEAVVAYHRVYNPD
ncbi:MAG: hypothetical protein KatS3mg117_2668 [Geminicoccaceae bacterium]|nr:MAG: hypothetical protein KatS3mg117_2668 [Geminicoccaceae bacterium]